MKKIKNDQIKEELKYLEKETQKIHGWTTLKERSFLFYTAKSLRGSGVIVEIGSWKGKSTIWLARGSKAGANIKVYAIDPFTGSSEHQKPGVKVWTFDQFKHNINEARVDDIICPTISTSKNAAKDWNKPIEFLFIDAAHEYEFVLEDFLIWSPHLIEGGTIAFHDTTPDLGAILRGWPIIGLPGPKKVAIDHIFNSKKFKDVKLIGSIIYATKCANRSFIDSLKNKFCKLKMDFNYFLYYIYARLTNLPQPIKSSVKKIIIRSSPCPKN